MIACTRPTLHERWQTIGVEWRLKKKKKNRFKPLRANCACVPLLQVVYRNANTENA